MKKLQLKLAIFCLFILSNQAFSAEITSTKFGLSVAYDRILFNGDDRSKAVNHLYPCFTSIAGNGLSIGGVLLSPIDLLSDDFFQSRLKTSIYYDYYFNINSEYPGNVYPSLVDDGNGGYTSVNFSTFYYLIKDYSRINLEFQYSLKLQRNGLILNLGPSIYYTTTNNEIRKAIIFEGNGRLDTISSIEDFPVKNEVIRYEDNYRTAVYQDGSDKFLDGFALGFSGGIAYEFNVGSISLSPGLNYKYQKYFQNILFSINVVF